MIIDPYVANGDWNGLREVLEQLARPPQSSYDDGSERQNQDFVNFVYQRAATIPSTPTGNGIPSGWNDAPPAADGNPLWMSKSYQRHDGQLVGTWSTPIQQDGESLVVQYSTNAVDWHDTYADGDIYMRQKVLGGSYGNNILIVGEGTSGIVEEEHIVADSVTAAKISVTDLAAITAALGTITSGSIILSLGGDTRLRIDSSGIYVSNNAGSSWTEVIQNDSGTVVMVADILKAGEIITSKVDTNAITKQSYAYTAADMSISVGDNTVQTVSFTTTGAGLKIEASVFIKLISGASYGSLKVQLLRDSTVIYDTGDVNVAGGSPVVQGLWSVPMMVESPSADTYSYTINVHENSSIRDVSNRFLRIVELKK